MTQTDSIFDEITFNDGETKYGIIDYISTKHLYFFDFTEIDDAAYSILAIAWRAECLEDPKRFSVFCLINYPRLRLPKAKLIPKSAIKKSTRSIKGRSQKSHQKKSKVSYN